MKKYKLQAIKELTEAKKREWATNWLAQQYQQTLGTPEAEKQVTSAVHNMQTIEQTITFLKNLYKNESGKKED